MKYTYDNLCIYPDLVAPHAGVWIEISSFSYRSYHENKVAPHAGVWIEINKAGGQALGMTKSLPTRECGLKYVSLYITVFLRVAPHAGVLIEIMLCSCCAATMFVAPLVGV